MTGPGVDRTELAVFVDRGPTGRERVGALPLVGPPPPAACVAAARVCAAHARDAGDLRGLLRTLGLT